ncbi:MAG: cysteine--tRNA ligase [Dehalococcoidia bacterium]
MSAAPGLRLYNTASSQAEPIDLTKPVRVYVCGVTPYDTTHLGHAFTYVSFDLLVRYLRFLGAEVNYVQNVTDIDDDILIRSARVGKSWRQLGDDESQKFIEDMGRLNWQQPTIVRATDYIPEMVGIVQRLCADGYAYESNGSVYFDVKQAPQFGRRLNDFTYESALALANERGNFPEDPNKRDPLDFILWQAAKEGEPTWESPWGLGRPGWHIECSAMSSTCLGLPVTVHGGGDDLRFPHHEAEICQSECSTDWKFVEHWMHTAMVHSERQKMSKSLGNMVFVRDLLREYSPDVIRLHLLSHHYRDPWNYAEDELRLQLRPAERLKERLGDAKDGISREDAIERGADLLAALAADLDSPAAIGRLHELADGDAAARAVARVLATDVLGLRLE